MNPPNVEKFTCIIVHIYIYIHTLYIYKYHMMFSIWCTWSLQMTSPVDSREQQKQRSGALTFYGDVVFGLQLFSKLDHSKLSGPHCIGNSAFGGCCSLVNLTIPN